MLLAEISGKIVAYGSLTWSSQYLCFRNAGIPEIQDLVVAEAHRSAGIATRMIHILEDRARSAGAAQVGIGVGLYRDYGAAQRLYTGLGYVPDGRGVTFKNASVEPGAAVRADDDLVLWLLKDLEPATPLP